jgi:hypothetical protein
MKTLYEIKCIFIWAAAIALTSLEVFKLIVFHFPPHQEIQGNAFFRVSRLALTAQ